MSASESDGVEEAISGALRVMLTAAARAGEEVSRARQRAIAAATDASEARSAELSARLEAEQAAARTTYRGLDDPQWWTSADVDDIAGAYYTAAAWRDVDPEAASAASLIETEVHSRYGVSVDELRDTQLEAGHGAGEDAEHDRARSERERADARALEAAALLSAADRADDRAQGTAADALAWDSRERRAATREHLAATVDDPRAVEAKSLADLAQSRPPTAVTPAGARATATTRGSHVGTSLDRTRTPAQTSALER